MTHRSSIASHHKETASSFEIASWALRSTKRILVGVRFIANSVHTNVTVIRIVVASRFGMATIIEGMNSRLLFNASMVIAMLLTLTLWFVVAPTLPVLLKVFDESTPAEMAHMLTFYECGKLLGALVMLAVGDWFNMVPVIVAALVGSVP